MHRLPFIIPLAALVLGGCAAHAADAGAPAATPVTLSTALAPATRALYAGPASVAPARVYRIAFEVPGRVVAVNADVGDRVAAGSVLAAIATDDYDAQARVAAARASEAVAAAAKAHDGARDQERAAAADGVRAAQAQVARAQAAQQLADASRARFDALFASGDVAAQQHDQTVAAARDATAALAAARAQLAQAQAQHALVAAGARSEDVAASDAAARGARAAADLAGVTLGKTRIVAPADALVQERDVEPGRDAQSGAIAFVLVDAAPPDVLAAVPEADLDAIAHGTPAMVRAHGSVYRGVVTRIEPNADPGTRTAQVRVRVDGLRMRDGGIVDVTIGARRAQGQARVPLSALVTGPAGATSVLVYDPVRRTAARRAVRVLDGDGERALVTGLAPGTRVVRGGAALLTPGTPVKVVTE